MKKYALYILILITLVGFLGSAMVVYGIDPDDPNNPNNPLPVSIQNNSNQSRPFLFCTLGNRPKLQHLLSYASCIISESVIPLIFALAVAMFVWGVVQYVINSDEEAKKAKGKQFMIWGIIALTVMVSVWGLVKILGNTFGIEYAVPQVKVVNP